MQTPSRETSQEDQAPSADPPGNLAGRLDICTGRGRRYKGLAHGMGPEDGMDQNVEGDLKMEWTRTCKGAVTWQGA